MDVQIINPAETEAPELEDSLVEEDSLPEDSATDYYVAFTCCTYTYTSVYT
jgi:hypothetical protein